MYIEIDKIEEQIILGFLAKMKVDNISFHEVLEWWRTKGQVYLFHINNQLLEENKHGI